MRCLEPPVAGAPLARPTIPARALVFFLALALALEGSGKEGAGGERSPTRGLAAPEVILVPESAPWLSALAAPLVRRLEAGGQRPLLLVLAAGGGLDVQELLEDWGIASYLALAPERDAFPPALAGEPGETSRLPGEVLEIGSDPPEAALTLAARFWDRAEEVVTSDSEPERMILAAALAAHRGVPLIPLEPGSAPATLARLSDRLGARRATHVGALLGESPAPLEVETLAEPEVGRRLVAELGTERTRTVVLARAPAAGGLEGRSGWLAPYVSLARRAAVVLSPSPDGVRAQEEVERLVEWSGLELRSVLILADYCSLGTVRIPYPPGLPETPAEPLEIEPCSGPPGPGEAVSWGVGRLPQRSLHGASLVFARGLRRERDGTPRTPQVLVVANPKSGQLALCETIARATARELANRGLSVREFYRTDPSASDARSCAESAGVVLYEGHLADLSLFGGPAYRMTTHGEAGGSGDCDEDGADHEGYERYRGYGRYGGYESYEGYERSGGHGGHPGYRAGDDSGGYEGYDSSDGYGGSEGYGRTPGRGGYEGHGSGPAGGVYGYGGAREWRPGASEPPGRGEWSWPEPESGSAHPGSRPGYGGAEGERWEVAPYRASTVEPAPAPPAVELDGHPLVVLQSCHSLEEPRGELLFGSGAVALLGTSTNVHSASGSAFTKAFVDGLLEDGASLGEALRDGKNYFLCLVDLKTARNHRQQAKVYRVAMSFRLWGDPDLRLPEFRRRRSRQPGVRVELMRPAELMLRADARQRQLVETPEYFARLVPGSQLAGIVRRPRGRSAPRRLLPLLYLRVAGLEEGLHACAVSEAGRSGDSLPRSVLRRDPQTGEVYLLHLPGSFRPREVLKLRLSGGRVRL